MDYLLNVVFVIFVLSNSWNSFESYTLDFKSYGHNTTSLARIRRQAQKCGPEEFKCENGQCIWKYLICDGTANCDDSSDETKKLCLNKGCLSPHSHICKYGACVKWDARCDNIQDCLDNSDEENCDLQPTSTKCITPEQPQNGDWIYAENGTRGEANELANRQTTIIFSCHKNYTLSTTSDLAISVYCGSDGWSIPRWPTCRIDSRSKPAVEPELPSFSCVTPEQPQYGKWVYLSNDTPGEANRKVDINSIIKFSCDEGYKLSTTNDLNYFVLCSSGGSWSTSDMPTCEKLCQPLHNSPQFTLKCTREDGLKVPCDKATANTILRYQCAPYYEPADGRTDSIFCYHNGRWERTPECIPVCGQKRAGASEFIVGGETAKRGDYPWVVAIYSNKDFSPNYINICEGSLLKTDVVITAAHCVTSKITGKIFPLRYYRVAAGKYYNKYADTRDVYAQYAEIAEIQISNEYKGEVQNFRGDIALLRLGTEFALSEVVQPVCYLNLPNLIPRTSGWVTGWGYTTSSGDPSDVLKEIELPYIEESQCESELDETFALRYLTSDKFCAGFYNENRSVCKGDSGGGLVFTNPSYMNRYFIHGIVSVGQPLLKNQEEHCNIQKRALFTKVNIYSDWIKLTLARWESKMKNR